MRKEERKLEWLICGWDDKTLDRDESWFQGAFRPYLFEDLGTINMLKEDVREQLEELDQGIHPDGYLVAWGEDRVGKPREAIVTQDGVFVWNQFKQDYEQVLIESIYEKEYFDDTLIEGYKHCKDYFATIIYK